MGCSGCSNGEIRRRFEKMYSYNEFETLYDNKNFNDIINFADTRKGDLYINLIHYDTNIKNEENFEYYRYFSINIIGNYYAFDDFDMIKLFISKLQQIPFSSSYILMTSGKESEKVLEEFNKLDFLIEFIIFYKKGDYDFLKKKYDKIKLITDNFSKVRKYLKEKKFSEEDLSMDNHLFMTPVITNNEYKKILFLIHRILAYFFKYKYHKYYISEDDLY